MTHEEAVASSLVEKYTLGELTDPLREEFEEHFFSCIDCAADVRATYELTEEIRYAPEAKADEPQRVVEFPRPVSPPWRRRWGNWTAAAAGALFCLAGYQNLVQLPRLNHQLAVASAPYQAPKAVLFRMGSRAGETNVPSFSAGQPLLLHLEIPVEARWNEYEVRVEGLGASSSLVILRDQAREAVPVSFPKGSLRPGTYHMRLFGRSIGGDAQLLAEREFAVL